jgi:hypothetical protein
MPSAFCFDRIENSISVEKKRSCISCAMRVYPPTNERFCISYCFLPRPENGAFLSQILCTVPVPACLLWQSSTFSFPSHSNLMSPLISNDLNSPVSHLWAHQLRREHATIVDQLGELKALHPSAVELKKLVTRTEKVEAATTKFRKEFTELKSAHQKSVKVIEALENELQVKDRDREADLAAKGKNEESFRVEIEALNESLRRQEGELAKFANDVRKKHGQHTEISAVIEQKLLQKEDEITELRILVQALDQKIGDAVTLIKDSVECPRTKGLHSPRCHNRDEIN